MPTDKKIKIVEEYKNLIEGCKAVFITDFIGLTVEEISMVRRKLDDANAKYKVVKNTLFKIASKDSMIEEITENLVGTNGAVFVQDDPVIVAKTLNEIIKEYNNFKYKTGILEGKIISEEQLEALAKLPSKEVLQAQMLALFVAPATNMVNLLAATPRNFLNLLNAYKNQKEN